MRYERYGDPLDDFERRDRELELRRKKLPVCCECGEYIQDLYAYHKDGLWYHQTCMSEYLVEVDVE